MSHAEIFARHAWTDPRPGCTGTLQYVAELRQNPVDRVMLGRNLSDLWRCDGCHSLVRLDDRGGVRVVREC